MECCCGRWRSPWAVCSPTATLMASSTSLSTDHHYKKKPSDLHSTEVLQAQSLLCTDTRLRVQLQHLLDHLNTPLGDLRQDFLEGLTLPTGEGGLGIG